MSQHETSWLEKLSVRYLFSVGTGMTKKTKIAVGFATFVAALIVVPNFFHARVTKATNACLNNLRQIDGAKQQWALENNGKPNDILSWDAIRPYIGRGTNYVKTLACPDGGTYILGRIGEDPKCSFHRQYTLH